jgi:hypothetical protein
MPVDWQRGSVAGLLASLPGVVLMSAFCYVYMFSLQPEFSTTTTIVEPYGTMTITSSLSVLLLFWLISVDGVIFGCVMGIIFSVFHEYSESRISARNGWKYGLVYGLAQVPPVQPLLDWVSAVVVIEYVLVAFLVSVLVFGSLIGRLWNKKLYVHAYSGPKWL